MTRSILFVAAAASLLCACGRPNAPATQVATPGEPGYPGDARMASAADIAAMGESDTNAARQAPASAGNATSATAP